MRRIYATNGSIAAGSVVIVVVVGEMSTVAATSATSVERRINAINGLIAAGGFVVVDAVVGVMSTHSVVLAYISGGAGSPTFRGALIFSDYPQ